MNFASDWIRKNLLEPSANNFFTRGAEKVGDLTGIAEALGNPWGSALSTRYQIDPEVNYKAELLRDKVKRGHITSDTDALIQLGSAPDAVPFVDKRSGFRFIPSTMATPKEGGGWLEKALPQVLGAQAQPKLSEEYDLKNEIAQVTPDPYISIRELAGDLQPVQDIVVPDDVIERYVANAMKYAGRGTTNPNESNLMYRYNATPEMLEENAQYVGEYIRAVMTLAPYLDLPPKTMAAMLMEESGWGGQRFDGNLGGYGFLGTGTPEEDMGIRFPGETPAHQAWAYLQKVASDWDGRYRGSRSPMDFHLKGYNNYPEYPGRILGVMGLLEAE